MTILTKLSIKLYSEIHYFSIFYMYRLNPKICFPQMQILIRKIGWIFFKIYPNYS